MNKDEIIINVTEDDDNKSYDSVNNDENHIVNNDENKDLDDKDLDDKDTNEDLDDDKILINKLKEDISRNSIEIADIKNKSYSVDSEYTTQTININKTKHFPQFVYANIFDEDIKDKKEEWTNLKRYRFQKCLWKLRYNRIISHFYLDTLKRREQRWSWMIIVISTITSGLTVANNVEGDNVPIEDYNTYINVLLTVSSMSTSLIASWIKKQMFIEKINEIDKYLININSLCEDLDIQLSLLNTDRTSYSDFKKKYIPEMTKYLTTNPIIPPNEWKACIREITTNYPEILNIDNSEDNKMWPWYGDLIFDKDDYNNESHTRYPTSFMKYFKRSNTDKLRSSCCGGNKYKINKYSY